MKLPKISSYGDYESSNYGVNSLKVSFEKFDLYYSYQTIVAYCDAQDGFIICENQWGVTTGKHLNWINPDHKARLPYDEFQKKLQAMLARHTQ